MRNDDLNSGVTRKEVWSWAFYDFANSGYTTVVLTAVFNAYFVGVVAAAFASPTLVWTLAISFSSLLVFLLLPVLGHHTDKHANKKRWLAWVTVGCVLGTLALCFANANTFWWTIFAIVFSNFCFQAGVALNSAFLPEMSKPEAVGRLSGFGWSIGYLGGLLSLGLCLSYVLHAQKNNIPATDYVPVNMLIVAVLYALAALPMFLFVKERAAPQQNSEAVGRHWLHTLYKSFTETRHHPDFRKILLCGLFYQAGINVVITLAAIYASEVMHFSTAETMMLILLVNITAAIGAFIFGRFQDKLGHRLSLGITLIGWMIMVALAASSSNATVFWISANIAGLCMGSSQSAGRALVGWMAPENKRSEYYGLWNSALGLSAIIGPPTYGLITWLSQNNHRLAIAVSGLYFVVGWFILQTTKISKG